MAVCWLSARTCRGWAEFIPTRSGARLFVLARHRFSFSRHSFTLSEVEGPLLFTVDGRPCGLASATRPAPDAELAFLLDEAFQNINFFASPNLPETPSIDRHKGSTLRV